MVSYATICRAILPAVLLSLAMVNSSSGDEFYAAPSVEELRQSVEGWLQTRPVSDELRAEVSNVWLAVDRDANVDQRFDALMQTFYLADDHVRELVDACLVGNLA
jgi:hypothetical protein